MHPLIRLILEKASYTISDFQPLRKDVITHVPTSRAFLTHVEKGSKGVSTLWAEYESLKAMSEALDCPDPVSASTSGSGMIPDIIGFEVSDAEQEAGMVTQYFDLNSGSCSARSRDNQLQLARRLAQMHSHTPAHTSGTYGFALPTYCGVTAQDNTWEEEWEVFWRDRRLGDMVRRIGDKRIGECWEEMKERVIPLLLSNFNPPPRPVILHGDLWSGNVGFDKSTCQVVIFDPCSYYGHNEADLGIMHMFGGFSKDFFDEYHKVLPRSEPFYHERQKLYELYHHLNHTLMFGGGYSSGAIRIMEDLIGWAEGVKS